MKAILSFDVDAEAPILALGAEHRDNAMVMTHQAFGPKVGVPRILGLLADYGIRATFFVPGVTALRYPDVIVSIAQAGHEVGHHSHRHHSAISLGRIAEREDFELALRSLETLDIRPAGHRAAMWEASWQTPELIAEYGLTYDSSLMDDDRPYVLQTRKGPIVEIPPHWSLDDWEQYAFLPRPDIGSTINAPQQVAQMWMHELDAMCRHGALFVLTCHPFLSGRAGRVEALRTVIEAALNRGDVEFATCSEVAEATLSDPAADRRDLQPPDLL